MSTDSACDMHLLTSESRCGNPFPLLRKEDFYYDDQKEDVRYIPCRVGRQIYQIVEVPQQTYAWSQVGKDSINREDRSVALHAGIQVPTTEEPLITGERRRVLFAAWDQATISYIEQGKVDVKQGFKALAMRLALRLRDSFYEDEGSVFVLQGKDYSCNLNLHYLFHKKAGDSFSASEIFDALATEFGCDNYLHVYSFNRLVKLCSVVTGDGKWEKLTEETFSEDHVKIIKARGIIGVQDPTGTVLAGSSRQS